MKKPANFYAKSERAYPDLLDELRYPLHDLIRPVYDTGQVNLGPQCQPFISKSLAGEIVGLRELKRGRWLVTFLDIDLGIVDERSRSFEHMSPAARAEAAS
jgi:hypothetical protein